MTPLEQAQAILGEHYKNYVLIVQDDESPSVFEMAYSCPYATTGLMIEGSKYHHALMDAMNAPEEAFEWIEEGESDEEEPDW